MLNSTYDEGDVYKGLRLRTLSSLPLEIGQLVNLQTLNLSNNQLSSLPGEIGQLVNLSEDPGDVNEILNFYFRSK
ncbi:hypothetical protein HCG51_00030 [Tolypothrix sp. PCC 7910]|uniref:leucine-rich repeat domain-containing protein n=1 Tax=Tolypothrix sp. PCC 7910 TaxID=2099387 RepID=UPI0014277A48|nr:leucine-rich repeat domain-containing protein [Tolypothrix sp. PCC 7910]QIR35256.1 hypothetical protein HCG51_00030 [Tolypothrix sp. PCC 7910]